MRDPLFQVAAQLDIHNGIRDAVTNYRLDNGSLEVWAWLETI